MLWVFWGYNSCDLGMTAFWAEKGMQGMMHDTWHMTWHQHIISHGVQPLSHRNEAVLGWMPWQPWQLWQWCHLDGPGQESWLGGYPWECCSTFAQGESQASFLDRLVNFCFLLFFWGMFLTNGYSILFCCCFGGIGGCGSGWQDQDEGSRAQGGSKAQGVSEGSRVFGEAQGGQGVRVQATHFGRDDAGGSPWGWHAQGETHQPGAPWGLGGKNPNTKKSKTN